MHSMYNISAEGKERVELHHFSPSGPSWPVLGWTSLYITLMYNIKLNLRHNTVFQMTFW
jgi:hypothetical protein